MQKRLQDFISQITIWNKDSYDTLGEPYDFYSRMHYPLDDTCSKNGKKYWIPKVPGIDPDRISNVLFIDELSEGDIHGIKKVYKCPY
jgi:hypothetical protein